MKAFYSIPSVTLSRWLFALALCVAPQVAQAATWQANAGAQSTDEGIQALAFLSNELWIQVGDSITWTFPAPEIHTVTFLRPAQVRPARPGVPGGGCPGTTPDGSSFDGSTCVTSSELVNGQTYTVTFPKAGNFKLVCLVHNNMTGAVHVLDSSEVLPHDQAFYDDQAHRQQSQLLADGSRGSTARGAYPSGQERGGHQQEVSSGSCVICARLHKGQSGPRDLSRRGHSHGLGA